MFSLLFLLDTLIAFTQQTAEALQDELEELLENSFAEDETKDVEQLLNDLQYHREHPVNINTAGVPDLEALCFLSPLQIKALLEYREMYGRILSVYELADIAGFDEKSARLLGLFVTFGPQQAVRRAAYAHHELLMRETRLLEKQAGYKEPRKYEGSPDKFYLRYHYSSASVTAGYTGEKDAGERFFKSSGKKGFDYNSAFAQIDLAENKTFFLGDYVVQFGQGLVAWQGFSLGKSAEATSVAKFNQGIKSYRSTDENNFMRGAACSFKTGKLCFSPFISLKKFDANTDSVEGEKVFTSFQSSGYHRTASEIEDKHAVSGLTYGGNISYEGNNFSLGFTGIYAHYQYPLVRKEDLYNLFLFEGDHQTNLSLDYQWSINHVYVFGELASDCHQGVGILTGTMIQPLDQVEISVLYRNIGKHYSSPLASSFTESSQVNDERGLYLGAHVLPLSRIIVDLYIDFFSHDWFKYTTAGPGKGREFLFRLNYQANSNWQILGRYLYECKPVKITGLYSEKNLDQVRQSVRLQLSGRISPSVAVKSRLEQSVFHHDHDSYGFFISQDVGYQPEKSPLTLWGRIAYFNTGDYDSRIYAYENDLLYSFSIPAFYGRGIRSYLTGKVKVCEKAEFWYKVSRSWFFNVQSIGSGYGEIEGNKRTEVKFELRFRI